MFSSGKLFQGNLTGGNKRFLELLSYLKSCKTNNLLFISQDDSESVKEYGYYNHIKIDKEKKIGIYKVMPPEMRSLVSNTRKLKKIKKENYDKLIAFDVPPTIGLVLLGFKNLVLMVRKDMIGYERTINHSWTLYLKIALQWICESLCMMRCCKVICQCNYDKIQLMKRHPLLSNCIERKTRILINNVNPSWIVNNTKEGLGEVILKEKKGFRICFIGNFDTPRKGHQLFLDASQIILKQNKNVEFVLIGGGNTFENYRSCYSNENVFFTGKLNNPNTVLKQCDLLVVPSYADSCPNTVMEALYNGVPVIGSRAGGIPEILLDEDTLFDLEVNSLVDSINTLRCNPAKLEEIKEKQRIRKNELTFDWGEKMMNLILED